MKKIIFLITALVILLSACISENYTEASSDISSASVIESDNTDSISSETSNSKIEESFISSEMDDISSEAPVIEKMHYEQIDISPFEEYIVYTDILDPGGIWPMETIFRDYDRFIKSHYGTFTKEQLYNIDRTVGDYPSYREWVKKYDEKFFEEQDLIVIIAESDFDVPPIFDSIYRSSMDRITMYIYTRDCPREKRQGFHLFVEMPKGYLGENPETFGVLTLHEYVNHFELEHRTH